MPATIHSDAYLLPGSRSGALLLHGFTASPTETRPLGEFLHNRGMTVLGVRLAGHGTTSEDLRNTTWNDWYGSAEEGFRELDGRVDRLFVGGVSLGGVMGAMLAADHPGRIAGLSLLAPSFFLRSRLLFLTPLIARFRAELPKRPESRAYYERHGLFSYPVRPTRSLVELRRIMRVGCRRLREVRTPTQIIMGQRDRLVDPASGGRILAQLASPQKELLFVENSDHILTVEPDAPEVFEHVWRFFARQ
ncbi:MAG: alpha/beta fold hydrolase [Candidatus Latescibacteria bacterium]|nr:alpha/beta fold hydrolase [Candidatus Latescibacterota bacterium]